MQHSQLIVSPTMPSSNRIPPIIYDPHYVRGELKPEVYHFSKGTLQLERRDQSPSGPPAIIRQDGAVDRLRLSRDVKDVKSTAEPQLYQWGFTWAGLSQSQLRDKPAPKSPIIYPSQLLENEPPSRRSRARNSKSAPQDDQRTIQTSGASSQPVRRKQYGSQRSVRRNASRTRNRMIGTSHKPMSHDRYLIEDRPLLSRRPPGVQHDDISEDFRPPTYPHVNSRLPNQLLLEYRRLSDSISPTSRHSGGGTLSGVSVISDTSTSHRPSKGALDSSAPGLASETSEHSDNEMLAAESADSFSEASDHSRSGLMAGSATESTDETSDESDSEASSSGGLGSSDDSVQMPESESSNDHLSASPRHVLSTSVPTRELEPRADETSRVQKWKDRRDLYANKVPFIFAWSRDGNKERLSEADVFEYILNQVHTKLYSPSVRDESRRTYRRAGEMEYRELALRLDPKALDDDAACLADEEAEEVIDSILSHLERVESTDGSSLVRSGSKSLTWLTLTSQDC